MLFLFSLPLMAFSCFLLLLIPRGMYQYHIGATRIQNFGNVSYLADYGLRFPSRHVFRVNETLNFDLPRTCLCGSNVLPVICLPFLMIRPHSLVTLRTIRDDPGAPRPSTVQTNGLHISGAIVRNFVYYNISPTFQKHFAPNSRRPSACMRGCRGRKKCIFVFAALL